MRREHGKSHTLRKRWGITTGVLFAEIDADYSVTAKSVVVPYRCEIIDVTVHSKADNVSGTATVRNDTDAISDAIIMAVDNIIDHSASLEAAYATLLPGAALNVIANGAADRGLVSILVRWL